MRGSHIFEPAARKGRKDKRQGIHCRVAESAEKCQGGYAEKNKERSLRNMVEIGDCFCLIVPSQLNVQACAAENYVLKGFVWVSNFHLNRYPVSPGSFGPVERLVGSLYHILRLYFPAATVGNADADGNRDFFPGCIPR